MACTLEYALKNWKESYKDYFETYGNPANLTEEEAFCFWFTESLDFLGHEPDDMIAEIIRASHITPYSPAEMDVYDVELAFMGLAEKGLYERVDNGFLH